MRRILIMAAAALFWAATALFAQEGKAGLTKEVFYLMPDMAFGTIQFNDKAPARGDMNICAVDNSIRYMEHGTELSVELDDSIVSVTIGNVLFVPYEGVFLRIYPFGDASGVAVRRNVVLLTDGKMASFGMESNTTAVSSIVSFNTGFHNISLEESLDIPYRLNETAFLYRDGNVMTLTKRNLTRCFPNAKADIEAWFGEHKKLSQDDVQKVLELCREWSEK